jgi:hypothetical protein
MNESHMADLADRASAVLATIARVGTMLSGVVGERTARLVNAVRQETRRIAAALALALVAAVFAIAAAGFAAVALLAAMWDTHPVLGAGIAAGGFALLTVIAVLLMRSSTRTVGAGR